MTNPVLLSYQGHKEEINAAIQRVLDSGTYILGEEVRQFEEEFARYIGVGSGVGVASGTDALLLALKVWGVGKGDEVITVSNTAVATVAAIELAGATPVLVDVYSDSLTMDVNLFQDAISLKTKAVIPVHLYGHPCDMKAITEIAQDAEVIVIEDCAQSHGALYNGKKTGCFGNAAAFSFYPTKNLGAIGDGGMVVTKNEDAPVNLRALRQYGWYGVDRSKSLVPGMNTRLDEIQAAILRVKLNYLDVENIRRRRVANTYNKNLPHDSVKTPKQERDTIHVYHQYVIRTEKRDELRKFLSEHGIETAIHYPIPIHHQPTYKRKYIQILPVTEKAAREILSLPMHPYVTDKEAEDVCEIIKDFFGG
jgi:dTDP-4-amino-4,6-dideoxygalactose transaminase